MTRPGVVEPDVVELKHGVSVSEAIGKLSARPNIETVAPNYTVEAADFLPNDPGWANGQSDWRKMQPNFTSLGVPRAWQRLHRLGVPGARGTTVAVLDTGIAYRDDPRHRIRKTQLVDWSLCRDNMRARGCLRQCHAKHPRRRDRWCRGWAFEIPIMFPERSPDFRAKQFVPGRDIIDGGPHPDDENGHGTHVAGTIASATNNGIGVTGLAYGAKLMPVRVLDEEGVGNAAQLARGIIYAVDHGADVINMSLSFPAPVGSWSVPSVTATLDYAERKGVVVVAAAGNQELEGWVDFPARFEPVISVAAATSSDQMAPYSNWDYAVDMAAPGGFGSDPIYQATFTVPGNPLSGFSTEGLEGTSMATPHVAATAAMVIASYRARRIDPTPERVRAKLSTSASCGLHLWDESLFAALFGRCIGLDVAAAVS